MPSTEITFEDPSKPLDNPAHETFARLVGTREVKTDWEAYKIAFGCSRETAEDRAYLMRKDVGISRRMAWFLQQAASTSILTLLEKREHLARNVRCNLATIDLQKDGDLLTEITRDRETGRIVKLKLPDKRGSIETDARLAGEWEPGQRSGDATIAIQQAVIQVFGRGPKRWAGTIKVDSMEDVAQTNDCETTQIEGV